MTINNNQLEPGRARAGVVTVPALASKSMGAPEKCELSVQQPPTLPPHTKRAADECKTARACVVLEKIMANK